MALATDQTRSAAGVRDDHLTDDEARNAAICLLAADSAMCDGMTPEDAVAFVRRLERSLDEEPWAAGKHEGDCTKQPMTCTRCVFNEAEADARRIYADGR